MEKNKSNKQGVIITLETVVFLILNLVFLIMLLVFAYDAGNRYYIYEESYAKQVALLIDNARPEMAIIMDVRDLIEIAKKQNKPLDEIFSIDEDKNIVKVSLGGGGYSYKYFSDYEVNLKIDKEWLTINVKDN